MKMLMMNTDIGLIPCGDESYENRKILKQGQVYEVSIKLKRNLQFHRKYMKLMSVAWEFLPEPVTKFFNGNKRSFRHTVETAAGSFEMVYDISEKRWVQMHKSVSFDRMSQDEFNELYERVKDVLYSTFLDKVDKEKFEMLIQF